MRQLRFRPLGLAALAISFAVFVASSGPAFAAPSESGAARRDEAPGIQKQQQRAAEETAVVAAAAPVAPAEEVVAQVAETGGGQVCDGDPSGKSDAGGGANAGGDVDDEYQHECGDPSQNGSGEGQAIGRPDAGAVGNADDKNPPGQFKNGNDANAGYECDAKGTTNGGNQGVGVGNPAHTRSCIEAQEPSGECPEGSEMCETRACPLDGPLPPGSLCEDPTPPPTPRPDPPVVPASTGPAVQASVFARPAEVLGIQVSRSGAAPAPAALARTGTEVTVYAQLGAGLVVLGGGLLLGLRLRPRRRSAA